MKEQEYLTHILVNYCMPTLWNRKPASVINVFKKYITDTVCFFEIMEATIRQFGCEMLILYENDRLWNVFLYHVGHLTKVIQGEDNKEFLYSHHYECCDASLEQKLCILKTRYVEYKMKSNLMISGYLVQKDCYPHEIGIFLGFPVYDVEDFIRFNGKNYLYCGFWKVYHELEYALRTFEGYRAAKEISLQYLKSGRGLTEIRNLIT